MTSPNLENSTMIKGELREGVNDIRIRPLGVSGTFNIRYSDFFPSSHYESSSHIFD